MKKININWILAVFVLFTAWSCSEESNLQPEGQWDLSVPSVAQINGVTLDEANPNEKISFQWDAAVSSARYGVYYTLVIDSVDAQDLSNPILTVKADNSGKSTTASVTYSDLNDALYMAGYKPGVDISLKYSVVADCLSKSTTDEKQFTVVRYDDDQLFLAGSATEVGDNVTNAIKFKRLKDAAAEKLNVYEIHTSLKANKSFMVYNGKSAKAISYGINEDGLLERGANPLSVEEEGVYKIIIDFDAMSVTYFKIESLGIIGSSLTNGWNSDEDLEYHGDGVWQSDISFVSSGDYIIRANNSWDGIIKKVSGTSNTVAYESFANDKGIGIENIPQSEVGYYTVTLTLNADEYSIDLEKAPDERMYVIVNGTDTYELSMVGEGTFATTSYIALQSSDQVIINTESDGSGISYSTTDAIEAGSGDKVSGSGVAQESTNPFSVSLDQAFGFVINVNEGTLDWHYYNLKLFHWDDDADGGWDAKLEAEMTYAHPFTYTVTADLSADFESKFFSPWDIQFGAGATDDMNALVGTMTNDSGASNFKNISETGTYNVTVVVADDFSTATYEFVKQ
ncbi:SusE domain-containing protein [Plebeiibacterium sediminum]|uniref:SusE domain-containing protein n=1 Tax=Plebeiibacterium sediminum TaxID=2992112 RepID=A0AAE3SER9_9BACT|nr:SusE domain-containing protein [Plebeiobacterium sediminum]MCW3786675.1 SusE domain-containing protein [Plebeiobacterium sediminum]